MDYRGHVDLLSCPDRWFRSFSLEILWNRPTSTTCWSCCGLFGAQGNTEYRDHLSLHSMTREIVTILGLELLSMYSIGLFQSRTASSGFATWSL